MMNTVRSIILILFCVSVALVGCEAVVSSVAGPPNPRDVDACVYLHRAGEAYRNYTTAKSAPPADIKSFKAYLLEVDADTSFLYWLAADDYAIVWGTDPRVNGSAVIAQSALRQPQLLADGKLTNTTGSMLDKAREKEPGIAGGTASTSQASAPPPPPPALPGAAAGTATAAAPPPYNQAEAVRAAERWVRLYEVWVDVLMHSQTTGNADHYFRLAGTMQEDYEDIFAHMQRAGTFETKREAVEDLYWRQDAAQERYFALANSLQQSGTGQSVWDHILQGGKCPGHFSYTVGSKGPAFHPSGKSLQPQTATTSSIEWPKPKPKPAASVDASKHAKTVADFVSHYEKWLETIEEVTDASSARDNQNWIRFYDQWFDTHGKSFADEGVTEDWKQLSRSEVALITILDQRRMLQEKRLESLPDAAEVAAILFADVPTNGPAGPARTIIALRTQAELLANRQTPTQQFEDRHQNIVNSHLRSQVNRAVGSYLKNYQDWIATFATIKNLGSASAAYNYLRSLDAEFDTVSINLAELGILEDLSNIPSENKAQLTAIQSQHQAAKEAIAKLKDFKAIQKGFSSEIPTRGPLGPARVKAKIQEYRTAHPEVAAAKFPEVDPLTVDNPFAANPSIPSPSGFPTRPPRPALPTLPDAGNETAPATATTPAGPGVTSYKEGMRVQILWAGTWYPGKIVQIKGSEALISYDDHSDSFNEWVTPDRVRHLK